MNVYFLLDYISVAEFEESLSYMTSHEVGIIIASVIAVVCWLLKFYTRLMEGHFEEEDEELVRKRIKKKIERDEAKQRRKKAVEEAFKSSMRKTEMINELKPKRLQKRFIKVTPEQIKFVKQGGWFRQ